MAGIGSLMSGPLTEVVAAPTQVGPTPVGIVESVDPRLYSVPAAERGRGFLQAAGVGDPAIEASMVRLQNELNLRGMKDMYNTYGTLLDLYYGNIGMVNSMGNTDPWAGAFGGAVGGGALGNWAGYYAGGGGGDDGGGGDGDDGGGEEH